MNSCKEFDLDDVMAITAIPVANILAADPSSAANSLTPVIGASGFSPSLAGAITIGRQPAASGVALIPIVPWTGKAKDSESDSVAGRLHTVDVTCEVDDRDGTVWAHLLTLERTPRHLLLTFRNKAQAFVSADRDTYTFTVGRDGAKTTASFTIHDLMGIQLLV